MVGFLLLPIKIVFQGFLFLSLTIFGSMLLTLSIILRFATVVAVTPFIGLHIICHECPTIVKVFWCIFLPLLTVFLILIGTILMLTYPIFRNFYPHGVYDSLENSILEFVGCYLGAMKGIFSW